jgi:hypothetical protein
VPNSIARSAISLGGRRGVAERNHLQHQLHPAGQNHDLAAMFEQLLDIGWVDAGDVMGI